jgi:septin family protein
MLQHTVTETLEAECTSLADAYTASVCAYLHAQFEATLIEESKVKRNPKSPDFQTHVALYFLDPRVVLALRGLSPVDKRVLRALMVKVNLVLVFGLSDLVTVAQMRRLREWVWRDVVAEGIQIYDFPDEVGDSEEEEEDDDIDGHHGESRVPEQYHQQQKKQGNGSMRSQIPFALFNDEELDPEVVLNPLVSPLPSTSHLPTRPGGKSSFF